MAPGTVPETIIDLDSWAAARGVQHVIWTDLPPRFTDQTTRQDRDDCLPDEDQAVEYLGRLSLTIRLLGPRSTYMCTGANRHRLPSPFRSRIRMGAEDFDVSRHASTTSPLAARINAATPHWSVGDSSALYMGDCLELMEAIPDNSIDCVWTDPPYLLSNDGITCVAGRMVKVNKGDWPKSRR